MIRQRFFMHARACGILMLLCALGAANSAYGEAHDANDLLIQLKQEMQALRQQLDEMKAVHEQQAAEIQLLKEQINEPGLEQSKAVNTADDIAALRVLAAVEAEKTPAEAETGEVTFKAGSLGLQALNPEISVTGDMFGTYTHQDKETDEFLFKFRGLGLHFESYLDPYTRFKAAVSVNEDEAKLGEAYFTRFGLLDDVNLTLGKFRQQFGVVNRWHKHGLDQVDFPLPLRKLFGESRLNQIGLSLDWNMPPWGNASQELTLQVTNGENIRLFGSNSWNTPCLLLHYKHFQDLSKNTYLELGTTTLLGWNDQWQVYDENRGRQIRWREKHDKLPTWVWGGDWTLRWEPTDRMRYRNLEWRSEIYYLRRYIRDPFTVEKDSLDAWGAYSYVQTKLSRKWDTGIRLDYFEPDHKWYAGIPGLSLRPLAWPQDHAHRWLIGPYVTWHQSPFVRFRLEYNHEDGRRMEESVDRIMIQAIFAAGPHKHERY